MEALFWVAAVCVVGFGLVWLLEVCAGQIGEVELDPDEEEAPATKATARRDQLEEAPW